MLKKGEICQMNNFYPYNNMPQYPQGYQANMQRQGQMFNNQIPQTQFQPMPMQLQQAQTQFEIPLREVKFVTSEEAKAYIVFPNTASLLIDKQQGLAYLKSADNMGQSFMEAFEFKKYEQGQETALKDTKKEDTIDLSNYIKTADLDTLEVVRKGDLDKIMETSRKEYEDLKKKVENLTILMKPTQTIGGKPNVATIRPQQ